MSDHFGTLCIKGLKQYLSQETSFLLFSILKMLFLRSYSLTKYINFREVTTLLLTVIKLSPILGISRETGKRVECKSSAVSDDLLLNNHHGDFNDFRDNNDLILINKIYLNI